MTATSLGGSSPAPMSCAYSNDAARRTPELSPRPQGLFITSGQGLKPRAPVVADDERPCLRPPTHLTCGVGQRRLGRYHAMDALLADYGLPTIFLVLAVKAAG